MKKKGESPCGVPSLTFILFEPVLVPPLAVQLLWLLEASTRNRHDRLSRCSVPRSIRPCENRGVGTSIGIGVVS